MITLKGLPTKTVLEHPMHAFEISTSKSNILRLKCICLRNSEKFWTDYVAIIN